MMASGRGGFERSEMTKLELALRVVEEARRLVIREHPNLGEANALKRTIIDFDAATEGVEEKPSGAKSSDRAALEAVLAAMSDLTQQEARRVLGAASAFYGLEPQ